MGQDKSGLVKPCELDVEKDFGDSYALVKHNAGQSSLFYDFQIKVHFKGIIGTCQPVYGAVSVSNITHGSSIDDWSHEIEHERKDRCTTRRDYVKKIMGQHADELAPKIKRTILKFIEKELSKKLD